MDAKQGILFGEMTPAPKRDKKAQTYEEFVDKFKPKLTTDDCYTPQPVYDAVLGWVRENCDIEGCRILRPFYPGGDYESEDYGGNDVVVDNPPFSIVTKIVRFYVERGIRFFLFAPYLTIFQPGRYCSAVVCDAPIVYENGAEVRTSFVTNMMGDLCAMSAPDLRKAIADAQKAAPKTLPKYVYPDHVIRACDLGLLSKRGIRLAFSKREGVFVNKLDAQGKKGIFGGGYLVSDRIAAERAAAERAAAERAAAERAAATVWELSPRELEIVKSLDK